MPTLVPLWSLCDHGEFEVIPFKEGGCSACKEQGLKRFNAVKSGNYKFITFGKQKASSSSSNYRGDVLWWYSEKDHSSSSQKKKKKNVATSIPQDAKGTIQVLDQNVKLIDEDRLTDILEVTERHEKPHFYSTSLNEFWSMIYHYGSIEECLKHVEEAEWEGSDDDEERATRGAFADLFSSMMGGYGMGDSDEEDEYYDEDEYDDDEYFEDDDDYDEDEDEYYDEEDEEDEDEEEEEEDEEFDDFGYDISKMHPEDRAHMRKLLNPKTYMQSPESDRPYNHPEWLNFFYQNSVLKNTMENTSRKSSTAPKQKQSKKDAEKERQQAEKELFDLLEKEEREKKQKQKQQQQQQPSKKSKKKSQQPQQQQQAQKQNQKQQPQQPQQQQPKTSPQKEQKQPQQQQKPQATTQQQQPNNKNGQQGSSKKKKKKH